MHQKFVKKGVPYVIGVFLMVCFFCSASLVSAEGVWQDDVCVQDYSILNTEDDRVEKLSSLNSKLNTYTGAEEHFLRLEDQLSKYKKEIENYQK